MANSQQKNHPNERMNTTTVARDGVAAARRATSSAKSDTRAPSDARVTATPASAARGSEGASAGRELRGEVAGEAATAARRVAARRGLCRVRGEDEASARGVWGGGERVTRGALGMTESRSARDEEEGAKKREKRDERTHPRAVARSRCAPGRATRALVAAAMARARTNVMGPPSPFTGSSDRPNPQKKTKVHQPGFEPGTFCVLSRRHNQLDHRCL